MRETRKVPNYKKPLVNTGGFFLFDNSPVARAIALETVFEIFLLCLGQVVDLDVLCFESKFSNFFVDV